MITIFSATNRTGSNTEKVALAYHRIAESQGVDVQVYRFVDLPEDFILAEAYGEPPKSFAQVLTKYILPVERFVFVIPEYNGSYPGITKLFLDTIHPKTWEGKKAALVGVASGRAGNLRGMDHLASVLNYLKVEVLSQKIPLSSIENNLNPQGEFTNDEYEMLLQKQLAALESF